MFLSEFISTWLNKEDVGNTSGNKGECVGLVSLWMDAFNIPHVWGHAKDLYGNAPTTFFEKIPNKPNAYPLEGDIIVWGKSWGGGFGHTGIVVDSNPQSDTFRCFEQNYPTGANPNIIEHKDWEGIVGWLRIKAYQPKGYDTTLDELEATIKELRTQRERYREEIKKLKKTLEIEGEKHAKEITKLKKIIENLEGPAEQTDEPTDQNGPSDAQKTQLLDLIKLFLFGR